MPETITAQEIKSELNELLLTWCDALTKLQIDMPQPELNGGILCPACGMIHGRCIEAVYPLMRAADFTGDNRYPDAAKALFAWGENVVCSDGGAKNDIKSEWKGITVFSAAALHDALRYHGHLLDKDEKAKWETRLRLMGDWLLDNIKIGSKAYINYYAGAACADALIGKYFGDDALIERAEELAGYCFSHISENGLLYGEGMPHDAMTKKGCRAIDFCYDAEESLPCLYRYAETVQDKKAAEKCAEAFRAILEWMLPDGAWDNSFGTRSFKWSYWGSRTTDGCLDALFALGQDDTVFSEAALRNLDLLKRCTHDSLLVGGPDYAKKGEKTCVHHTFCHSKTIAAALDGNAFSGFERCPLPAEKADGVRHYPELDAYRINKGSLIADVTGYDAKYKQGGHVSGGAVSLLWHDGTGPVIAAGMAEHSIFEPFNQQLPTDPGYDRCVCPRIEIISDGRLYAQHFDYNADISTAENDGKTEISVTAVLCSVDAQPLKEDGKCLLKYIISNDCLRIEGQVSPKICENARFILPLIEASAAVDVIKGWSAGKPEKIFSLAPGFICDEYTVIPDKFGKFALILTFTQH